MFDFQQKRKWRTVISSRITQGVLVIMTIMVSFSAYDRYLIARDMSERRTDIETEIKNLNERRSDLEKEVNYLESERGMEAEMRRQFDMAREGEKVILIVDDQNSVVEEISTTTNDIEEEVRAWYQFW